MPALWLAAVAVVAVSGGGARGAAPVVRGPAAVARDAGGGDAAIATTSQPVSPSLGSAEPAIEVAFDTTLLPRLEPVFVDARGLRELIDQFGALDTEMQKIRDEFSTAVQQTLAVLPRDSKQHATICPERAPVTYARASTAGARYLELGHRLEGLVRQIRRADDQGETLGLTPDYRNKARLAREAFRGLLSDYRDMRVAFYEQLGAELRHAGCDPKVLALGARRPVNEPAADPAEAASWVLEDQGELKSQSVHSAAAEPRGGGVPRDGAASLLGGAGSPGVWISIDNGDCAVDTRVSLDDGPVVTVAGKKSLPLRTHAGPHQICALPTDDPRECGAAGTVRKAYLHEGWTLTLHCRHP